MIYEWIKVGGPMMWPILGFSFLGLAIILERIFFWMRYWFVSDPSLRRDVYDRRLSADMSLMRGRDPVAEVAHWFQFDPVRGRLMADRLLSDSRRGLGVLETLANLSTSLGLFGTVVGVSLSFRSMTTGDAGNVVYGLGVALFTTVLGLIVHLYCGVATSFFNWLSDRLKKQIEVAITCAENGVRPAGEPRHATARTVEAVVVSPRRAS